MPKGIRDSLGLKPGDRLVWEVAGDHARVAAASTAFLERRGTIEVGPGSVVDDIRRARRERGVVAISSPCPA